MNYYNEIEDLIQKHEINKRARYYKDNTETLETNWNIGRLIVEAQGGKKRAKYGNELIKEWSKKLTNLYGNGYKISNLKYFRQFYIIFEKSHPLGGELTWSHIKLLLPIKNENKRNYYINLCIKEQLSKRELISRIKNNSYERLLNTPEKIEIIHNPKNLEYNLFDELKNPIIIKLNPDETYKNEKELQLLLLAHLKNTFEELGQGFTFVGNEYKIKHGNKTYKIDLLLFNIELIAYVVVELKTRELKPKDKAQIEFYMYLVDKYLKRDFHKPTIGIIISKHQNEYIVTFFKKESTKTIIPLEYLIEN